MIETLPSPKALKALDISQLPAVANACRDFLMTTLNQLGGHLGASLGVAELTLALHYVFDTPNDILIWDVGHQAQIHKMLTGRYSLLHTMRQKNGVAPFPSRQESPFDAFDTGHAGTAISAATGFMEAYRLLEQDHKVVAVVGDGGMTAGLSFEALNHAGALQTPIIIVYNDNGMSISPNTGALAASQAVGQWVEAMGCVYRGPIDGHHLPSLIDALQQAKQQSHPVFLHVKTQKGKGYVPAERNPVAYHAVSKQYLDTSKPPETTDTTYSACFGEWLLQKAAVNPQMVVITPAMIEGSGLAEFADTYPKRCFDVGIAEQHALTFAAGLAAGGLRPIVSIYATFLQRAIDQLIHDIALPKLPVILAIDRAGLVGADGATHMGNLDIALTQAIPNLVSLAPSSGDELLLMLDWAVEQQQPILIRYPKANASFSSQATRPMQLGKAKWLRHGERIALLVFGPLLPQAIKVAEDLNATLVDMRFVKPIDRETVIALANSHELLVTLEEHAIIGGAGAVVSAIVASMNNPAQVMHLGIPDRFIAHATRDEQLSECKLDEAGIRQTLQPFLEASSNE